MIDTPSIPKKREGTWLWLYKIVTGLFIIIFLGVHFVVNHLVPQPGY
jgi:succinate dehydrogenase hydrophobic anchor subunit